MRSIYTLEFGLVLCAMAAAQAPYQNISHQFWGSSTAFAGHSNWYEFVPKTAVPVTCNPSQSRCSASGHQFKGGEIARFYTQGKAPTGLYTMWGGSEAVYAICDLQGTSFTLRRNNCSGSVATFSDAGTGNQNVLVNIGKYTCFTAVSGFPAGTVLNWYTIWPGGIWSPLLTTNGIPFQFDTYNVALEAIIPPTATPGVYRVGITVAQDTLGNNASTLNLNISVIPTPR